MRIGQGYDVHPFSDGRPLIIGGVKIPFDRGLSGHSDADVLLHAITDALLGALALGDIGKHFPDTDPRYAGADSLKLLEHAGKLIESEAYKLVNCDATILLQRPKIAEYIPLMRENIAGAMKTGIENISVKATTEEKLGFTGSGEGAAAHAVVLIDNV